MVLESDDYIYVNWSSPSSSEYCTYVLKLDGNLIPINPGDNEYIIDKQTLIACKQYEIEVGSVGDYENDGVGSKVVFEKGEKQCR